ncbi:hypothetical protein [Stenotrophomonas sp. SrG]|uniref:hypothetical protein n=1 Tax=Stenotrophomonas sp. SrG TaxID=3414430 RepID=UPI003CEB6CDC
MSRFPVVGQSRQQRGWRLRFSLAVHFPARVVVYRFMAEVVRPAVVAVAAQLRDKGVDVVSRF